MLEFIKKAFFAGLTILSIVNPLKATQLKCECKVRPEIVNVNNDEPVFNLYSFSIQTSKCSGGCNNIHDPYARMCVPMLKYLKTNELKYVKN